jgi:hypothetical protein
MSQAHTFTHSHHSHIPQYFHHAPWNWKTCFHTPKRSLFGCLLRVVQKPLCLLKKVWIWTWVLTSLISRTPMLLSVPFQALLCNQNMPPRLARREVPSPRSTGSGGPGRGSSPDGLWTLSQWQTGENTTLQIPDETPAMFPESSDPERAAKQSWSKLTKQDGSDSGNSHSKAEHCEQRDLFLYTS